MIAPIRDDESNLPRLKRLKFEKYAEFSTDGSVVLGPIGWGVICLVAIVVTIYIGPAIPIGFSMLLLVLAAFIRRESVTTLAQKFVSLGTLAGRSKDEIFAVTGLPNSMSTAGDGKALCHWETAQYRITLIFDGEICDGVTHEWQAIR